MNYQTLKVGDVLQFGDEKRDLDTIHPNTSSDKPRNRKPGKWNNLIVIGRQIIGGDLAHLEFRRPVKS